MIVVLVVVAILVVAVFFMYGLFRMIMAAVRRRLLARISEKFRPGEIVMATVTCNFMGRESLGAPQMRGNGALLLTRDALWFLMAAPPRELRIPLDAVTKISFVKTHCGKTLLVDLLRVDYEMDGRADAAAWWVRDPMNWKGAIEKCKRA